MIPPKFRLALFFLLQLSSSSLCQTLRLALGSVAVFESSRYRAGSSIDSRRIAAKASTSALTVSKLATQRWRPPSQS